MDNKDNIEQFDNLFKEKFKDASVKAPDGVWEAVSGNIASGASSSWIVGKAIIVKTAISVATLTAVSFGVYKSIEKTEVSTEETPTEVVLEEGVRNVELEDAIALKEEDKIISLKEVIPTTQSSIENDEVVGAKENSREAGSLNQDNSSTDRNDPETASGSEEKGFVPFNGVIPDLKSSYCKGQVLELDLVGNPTDMTWSLNTTKIEVGTHLELSLNRTGVFHLILKQSDEVVYKHMFAVNSVDAKFEVNTIDDGTFMLIPNDHRNKVIWNANDGKGYRMSSYGSLSITDYTRERIPVTLIAESKEGCKDSTKQSISNPAAKEENILKVPDAFIPGGDGLNDYFVIEINHETMFNLRISKPSGELMFSSTDKNNSWDGRFAGEICRPGDYYYHLEYKLKGSDKQLVKRGVVRLLLEKD